MAKLPLKLEKNGRMSNSKWPKHIKVRYLFIKERVDHGEVNIKYCPTEQMWSDELTKPLQAQQFRLIRVIKMNWPMDYNETDNQDTTSGIN